MQLFLHHHLETGRAKEKKIRIQQGFVSPTIRSDQCLGPPVHVLSGEKIKRPALVPLQKPGQIVLVGDGVHSVFHQHRLQRRKRNIIIVTRSASAHGKIDGFVPYRIQRPRLDARFLHKVLSVVGQRGIA
jgi:hypothetical protein